MHLHRPCQVVPPGHDWFWLEFGLEFGLEFELEFELEFGLGFIHRSHVLQIECLTHNIPCQVPTATACLRRL